MKYGYGRVSTKRQGKNGTSLEEQRAALIAAGVAEENLFLEAYTGTKMGRPQFDALMEKLQPGDEFVVTKLDRFARTAPEGAITVRNLVNMGVRVHVLNMGIADNTPMGKVMVSVMLAFAEFERDMIVERTTAGREHKRESDPDYREGRTPIPTPDFEKFLKKQKDGLMTVTECCEALGISRKTWYRRVEQYGAA